MGTLTRRELIRWLGGAAVALRYLPGCGDNAGDELFSADQLRVLAGFADAVIPEDDRPGGAKLGAVAYIEGLLRAFDAVVPRIYAGGPFSVRHPFPDATGAPGKTFPSDDFANFIELDRVSLAAWQQTIADVRATLGAGVQAAIDTTPKSVEDLTHDDYVRLFDAADTDFRDLMIELVGEAAFSAPEYGGNPGLAGWKMIHFEGDIQPLGYSQWDGQKHVERADAPLSTPNPTDPEPLTQDVRDILALAVTALGGRVS